MTGAEPTTEDPSPLLVALTVVAVIVWVVVDVMLRGMCGEDVRGEGRGVEESDTSDLESTAATGSSAHLLLGDDVVPWTPLRVAAHHVP